MRLRPPRSADRARSPARVSEKREYFKCRPETIGDFAPKLFKLTTKGISALIPQASLPRQPPPEKRFAKPEFRSRLTRQHAGGPASLPASAAYFDRKVACAP